MTIDEHIQKAEEDAKMAEFPTYEEIAKKVAEKALDEFLYNGKSIREWMQIIASEDAISRQAVLDTISESNAISFYEAQEDSKECYYEIRQVVEKMPPVTPQSNIGYCKDCKYFEYDSVAKVDGIPLIVAHEICKRWGDGCKTKEDGYCFLFEPKMSEIPTGS